ncbi:MAG: efflux RND transporter periplasmic adaptor subunit [Bacteroidia bacterium]|nr:efflux RND transporter periplasmic adaptor subunit [Bacteroidia bacterium]
MNYLRFAGLLVIALVLYSCKKDVKEQNAKKGIPPVIVDVMIAGDVDFPSNIQVNGTVLSEEMIEMHPEISGRITLLNIPDGATVTAGTVLAKINDADLQAQMEQQKVQKDLAEKTEQRLKKLLDVNGVDQATYDAALSQLNLYDANIKVLQAQIDKTVIKAPFNGRLGLRLVSEGAYVTPSTLIGTLQQTDKIKIDFTVPETYENLLSIGKTVTIQTTGSKENRTAVISAIEPQINTVTRNIKVRARLENSNIRPGAFVKVLLNETGKRIVVPSNVIIPDALSNQVVVVKKGKATFRNVETGTRNSDVVEITNGLNPGDTVVVSGVLFVRPNARVKIRKVISMTGAKQ